MIADEIEQAFLGPDLRGGDDGADDDSRRHRRTRGGNRAARGGNRAADERGGHERCARATRPRRCRVTTPTATPGGVHAGDAAPALADTLAILALRTAAF